MENGKPGRVFTMNNFTERITSARKKAGLTQAEAAIKLGISHSTIQRYETGAREPNLGVCIDMAKLYGVNLHWLVTGEMPPEVVEVKIPLEQKRLIDMFNQVSDYTKGLVMGILQSEINQNQK
jgi:transcriptional regulator with XRE-family HTH domain